VEGIISPGLVVILNKLYIGPLAVAAFGLTHIVMENLVTPTFSVFPPNATTSKSVEAVLAMSLKK